MTTTASGTRRQVSFKMIPHVILTSFKPSGHVAPMYEHPDDDFYFFNAVIINLDKLIFALQLSYTSSSSYFSLLSYELYFPGNSIAKVFFSVLSVGTIDNQRLN